ncbi:MAG TPA: hypothetical protein VHA76_16190 [Solirubrobacterales bacterium]|nr:hypothetical protein [Solirubrobacterales bacterium]
MDALAARAGGVRPHRRGLRQRRLRRHRAAPPPRLPLLGDQVRGDGDREALRQELRQVDDNDRIKVTLVEPGITDTEFFDDKPAEWVLRDDDIAAEVCTR